MNTLTGQKAVLAEVRQREFEAYNQVKQSCHLVEQAQLEKAEVHVSSISYSVQECISVVSAVDMMKFPKVNFLSMCLSPPRS